MLRVEIPEIKGFEALLDVSRRLDPETADSRISSGSDEKLCQEQKAMQRHPGVRLT